MPSLWWCTELHERDVKADLNRLKRTLNIQL